VTIETIIWCSDPNKRSTIDHDWADEARAAASVGMNLLLVDHDRLLLKETDRALGNRELHEDSTDCLYRGWMMPVSIYTRFHEALRLRGLRLVTTPAQYEFCHHLPVNYHTIRSVTPETTVIPKNMLFTGSGLNLQAITDAIAPFGDEPIIVKDYVKSQKHLWLEACFVPKASDLPQVESVVRRFIDLQSEQFTGGLVLRRYTPLRQLGFHPKSGMPLSNEYRLFWAFGQRISVTDYWDLPNHAHGPIDFLDEYATSIPSDFFSLDLAITQENESMIMELGDGQVAGLPDALDPIEFYAALKRASSESATVHRSDPWIVNRDVRLTLQHIWDPIGVGDISDDEYDSYLGAALDHVQSQRDPALISKWLHRIESETMGLTGNIERCREVADRLLSLSIE